MSLFFAMQPQPYEVRVGTRVARINPGYLPAHGPRAASSVWREVLSLSGVLYSPKHLHNAA